MIGLPTAGKVVVSLSTQGADISDFLKALLRLRKLGDVAVYEYDGPGDHIAAVPVLIDEDKLASALRQISGFRVRYSVSEPCELGEYAE